MELRSFRNSHLHCGEVEVGPIEVVVEIEQDGRGLHCGSGELELTSSLAGVALATRGTAVVTTEDGQEFELQFSELDVYRGMVGFVTTGPVPQMRCRA